MYNVYYLKELSTGRTFYIGYTSDWERRKKEHIEKLGAYTSLGLWYTLAIRYFALNSISIEMGIIEEINTKQQALTLEEYYINNSQEPLTNLGSLNLNLLPNRLKYFHGIFPKINIRPVIDEYCLQKELKSIYLKFLKMEKEALMMLGFQSFLKSNDFKNIELGLFKLRAGYLLLDKLSNSSIKTIIGLDKYAKNFETLIELYKKHPRKYKTIINDIKFIINKPHLLKHVLDENA